MTPRINDRIGSCDAGGSPRWAGNREGRDEMSDPEGRMRRAFFRAGICLLPLAVTPIWIFLIAEGFLNFGGGEKDLFLVIPWLVWSALFLVIGVVAWVRGLSWTRGLAWSAAGATASLVVVGTGLLLFASGLLGVR